jgi:CDP-6-deoxy-D-xylo-4-hexulose-3-dehydrase
VLPEATVGADPAWFGFPITVRDHAGFTRDQLVLALNQAKVGTRLLFGGNLIRQPYMVGRSFRQIGDLAQADRIMRSTFWVGVYPGLGEAEIAYMVEQIGKTCRGNAG